MITQERLKELLIYDSLSGLFYWNQNHAWVVAGREAGCKGSSGYTRIAIDTKDYYAHRLVWLYVHGEFPEKLLDHVDGDRSNNKLENLRGCTTIENSLNRGEPRNNTSGFKGVSWNKRLEKWHAYATINGKRKHLGFFNSSGEAATAYTSFAKASHGEFYRYTQEVSPE